MTDDVFDELLELTDALAASPFDRELVDRALPTARAARAAMSAMDGDGLGSDPDLHQMLLDAIATPLLMAGDTTRDAGLLREAATAQRAAVAAASADDPDQAFRRTLLATCLGALHAVTGDRPALDEAVAVQRAALAALPDPHPDRPFALLTLATRLRELYLVERDRATLDEALAGLRAADRTTTDSVVVGQVRNALGIVLQDLFVLSGEPGVLDEALAAHRGAVEVTPPGAVLQAAHLMGLAGCLHDMFDLTGDVARLREAVETRRAAIAALPDGHPAHGVAGAETAGALIRLYQATGKAPLLDEIDQCVRRALAAPLDARNRAQLVAQLGLDRGQLFRATGDLAGLRSTIDDTRRALGHLPDDDPGRAEPAAALASLLADLHAATGEPGALDDAVRCQRAAVKATAPTSPMLPGRLADLANRLGQVHARRPDDDVLDEAIAVARRAAALVDGPGHNPTRWRALAAVAARLADRFTATGDADAIREAVDLQRQAIAALPAGSPERPGERGNLARYLDALHWVAGDPDVAAERDALRPDAPATAPGTGVDARLLNNSAQFLAGGPEGAGDPGKLSEAIALQRAALARMGDDHPERPGVMASLANLLGSLYAATGARRHLDEGLALAEEAHARVAKHAVDAHDLPYVAETLALRLAELHRADGLRSHLHRAIELQEQAVAAGPDRGPRRARLLANLAGRRQDLLALTDDPAVLDMVVDDQRAALRVVPPTSVTWPDLAGNLAVSLHSRFTIHDDRAALDEAVDLLRAVSGATPEGAAGRSRALGNLAAALRTLAKATDDRRVFDEAIEVQRRALEAAAGTAQDSQRNNLANLLLTRYRLDGEPSVLAEARELIDGAPGVGPWEATILARARADVAVLDGRPADAADALAAATRRFDEARGELGDDLVQRRDLAGLVEGLLGEVLAAHVLAGRAADGVALVEGDRMWLDAPPAPTAPPAQDGPQVTVAWIGASPWGTAVVTSDDDGRGPLRTSIVEALTHQRIAIAVEAASRADHDDLAAASQRVVDLASRLATALPWAERLLLVPLGVCALLPFAAAVLPTGGHLVDRTSVTVAPSLAWARAATRPRPGGDDEGGTPNVAAFVGVGGDDRRDIGRLLGVDPVGAGVLRLLDRTTPLAHFSCHGTYDHLRPWESALCLHTPLTLRQVVEGAKGPWLVNLSACSTAIPDLGRAEQMISFPVGFLRAGSAHVLANAWPVGDLEASRLNAVLYAELAAGARVADALGRAVRAVRDLSESGTCSNTRIAPAGHPFWWGAFTHIGSPW